MPVFLTDVETGDSPDEWVSATSLADCISDESKRLPAAQMAAGILAALSGNQFGSSTIKVRPYGLCGSTSWSDRIGRDHNFPACASTMLRLPTRVQTIDEIKVDGVALATDDWILYGGRDLERVGQYGWPCCQDLSLHDDEPNTWSISYTTGSPVPVGGKESALVLACELGKAMMGDRTCKLSDRIQSISREGVTVAVLDAMDFLDKRRTGLSLPDLWLSSVNPHGAMHRAAVFSPDFPEFAVES